MRDLLPTLVRDFLRATPFGPLIEVIPQENTRSTCLLTTLGGHWCDTTHTFHFRVDVFALTDLPFSGVMISPDPRLRTMPEGIVAALGWMPEKMPANSIPRIRMVAHIRAESEHLAGTRMSRQSILQLA